MTIDGRAQGRERGGARRAALVALLLGVAAVNFLWMPGEFVGGDAQAWRSDYVPSLLLANLWNLVLCVALAALLYALTAAYSARIAVRMLFVVAALYCTSLWFYQRAQSSEIYQTLLFTALFIALLGFLRPLRERGPGGLDARAWRWLATAWACAAVLLFIRVIYGLLLPLIVLLALWCAANGRSWRELRPSAGRLAAALVVPPALILVALGVVNHVGSPETYLPTGRLADGLWGFLFAPRFSIFLHFPLLVFALVGLRRFTERHRLDAVVMLTIFAVFSLVLAKTPSWAGEWTYGPRYLLPMLPVLSLPFLTFADEVLDRVGTWRARAWAAAALASLVYSGYLQVQVNRLPFWSYYKAREALILSRSLDQVEYLLNRHPGLIADDLVRHRSDLDALPYFAELKKYGPPEFVAGYRRDLGAMLQRGNLYWSLPPDERD